MRPINRDSLPHLCSCAVLNARTRIDTIFTRFLAYWWRVQLGSSCTFIGLPLFRRLPGSRIEIGDSCQFRSVSWSNFIGLNHRCILSTLNENAKIQVGSRCGFSGTAIGAAQSIVLGKRVMAGANTIITDTDWHPVDPVRRAAGELGASSPVVIEDDVWLGTNVVVLKGVTIGSGTTVAANSVVTVSLPAGVIAGGIPAKPLKSIAIGP